MHITQITVHNDFEQARRLYNAARAIFSSLPPVEVLENYSDESYRNWYGDNFEDTADGWSDGPMLFTSGSAMILETPTSQRLVCVNIAEGELWSCKIVFPDGSVNAAADVILAAQKQPLDRHKHLPITITYLDGVQDRHYVEIEHITVHVDDDVVHFSFI